MYAVVYMASGSSPNKRDFKKEHFEEVLGFFRPPEAWLRATSDFLKSNYPDVSDPRAIAICAMTRFEGVAEFGYQRGLFDRPFWITPPPTEVRQEVRISIHYV